MDLDLNDRAVIVTGASRGIGRATALSLAHEGAHLVLCARGEEALNAVAEEIRALGRRAVAVVADVSVDADRKRIVEAADREFGGAYGFVSNTTNTEILHAQLHGVDEADLWDGHYSVDVLGAVRLTELLAPGMIERGTGAIIFISSIAGKRAIGRAHGYVSMKAALIAAGKSLGLGLAPHGVRVNVVAPGTTLHPGAFMEAAAELEPALMAAHAADVASGRFSRPEEVADCIVFLLSPRSNRVVASCLVVDGGEYHGIG